MSKEKELEKALEYAHHIASALGPLLEEEHENYLGDDLFEGSNLTLFFHALGNMVPTLVYEEITGDKVNNLEFNHIANQLCFQFMQGFKDDSIKDENNEQ